METEQNIIEFLKKEQPQKTIQISKHIFGKDATKKMINPILYKMHKEKKLEKVSDVPPQWKLFE